MPIGPQDAALPFPLTPLDRLVLSQTDEEYEAHTWEGLKEVIGGWTMLLWFEIMFG